MEKKCFIGFDGYRDEVYRLIRKRTMQNTEYWDKLGQLGTFLQESSGKSADIEMKAVAARYGGNGPLMAGAMAALGAKVTCVGLLDGCEDLTKTLVKQVKCISIGPSGKCMALEFSDGKLMLGQTESMKLTWQDIEERIRPQTLKSMMADCELIGIVNWSAFLHMNDILMHIQKELGKTSKWLFFDLADFSARSFEEIKQLISLLKSLGRCHRIILGCNQKEAELLGNYYYEEKLCIEKVGKLLADEIPNGMVVIHGRDGAQCFHMREHFKEAAESIKTPKILTGAGDHFNAGFCCGILRGGSLRSALQTGNHCAAEYIRTGNNWENVIL